MRQLVYCLLLSASPGVNSLCWWSFIEECSNVMSDKILTANLKTWRWDPDQTPLSWHEDEIYTVSPFLGTQVVTLSLLLLSSHNIVLQCDIKYLQDESAGWSRRVCDPYLGIDSRPQPGHNTLVRLVTARVRAKAGLVMRTLTRNARHSDRRLSYSDSLLSHAQNLTFVFGHYFPNSSRRNIYFLCNTDCLFKIDPFNYLSRLVMFFSWKWKHK